MTLDDAVQLVAIAGVVKDTELGQAKKLLTEGSTHQIVNLLVRINGTISKGRGTPAAHGVRPATIELFTQPLIFGALKRLGIEPAALRKALLAALKAKNTAETDCEAYHQVFADLTAKLVAQLPPIPYETPARAGPVRTDVSRQILTAA